MNIRNWLINSSTKHRDNLLVLSLFVFLTAAASWPVLLRLNRVIAGRENDVYLNLWDDWWTAKAIREPETSLWQTDYVFYPAGTGLNYHSFSHLNTLASLALQPLIGVFPAYNIVILLNFVLLGFSMFQLARYLTQSVTGSILAGTVYAFNSHHLFEAAHPNLISAWCYPWLTLYLMRLVREKQVKWAVVAAGIVFLGTATSTLHCIMMIGWVAVLLVYMGLSKEWPVLPWRLLAVFTLLSALFTLPLLYPLLGALFFEKSVEFVLDEKFFIAADLLRPFIPAWYNWEMRGLYIGFVAGGLLLLAIGWQRKAIRPWLIILLILYLLSIGPTPMIAGQESGLTISWIVPLSTFLRNTARLSTMMALALALIVAYGWIAFSRQLKQPQHHHIAGAVLTLLIVLEYTGGTFPYTRPQVSPFYREFLAHVDDDVVVAILPTGRLADKKYMYLQTLHEHRMVGGHISRPQPEVFNFIYGNRLLLAGATLADPAAIPADPLIHLQALARANVGYLILEKESMSVENWREAIPLDPIYEDDFVLVYATSNN